MVEFTQSVEMTARCPSTPMKFTSQQPTRGSRALNNARLLIQRAESRAAFTALVDVSRDDHFSVRALVILHYQPFAGEFDAAQDDRRSVGVELLNAFPGGQSTGLIEGIEDLLLVIHHR